MALQKLLRISVKFMVIIIQVYILFSIAGCIQKLNGGSRDMPFQNLPYDDFLKTEIVNVAKYGASGNGDNDDSLAILRAIDVAGDNILLFPSGTYRISNNITFPANTSLWFANGAKLSIDSEKTVTINGKIDAGLYQIFSGSGSVSIAKGACEYLIPQWWGAVGDGTNDDTDAINKALDVASQKLSYSVAPKVQEVFLPNGIYKITSPIFISYGTSLRGNGMNSTIIDVYGDVNGINVTCNVVYEPYDNTVLENFRIRNRGTVGVGYGISMSAQRSASVEHVWIGGWYDEDYYFERGIYIVDFASYYTTIRRCLLMRNTYQISWGWS